MRREDVDVCLVRKVGKEWRAPRGSVEQIKRAAERNGVSLRWVSEVFSVGERRRPTEISGVHLRPYQVESVDFLLRRVQGLVVLPCGGGKTTIGVAALAALGEPSLVVVPTIDLVDQWVDRLLSLGVEAIRSAPDRPLAPGEVLVSTAHSFADGKGGDVLASVGALVVDECHRAPAPLWDDVVARCAARYRWGLTATPERADGLGFSLPFLFGEVLKAASAKDLIAGGWLRSPTVIGVATGFETPDHLFTASASCDCGQGLEVSKEDIRLGRPCFRCGAKLEERLVGGDGFRLMQYAEALSLLSADEDRTSLVVEIADAAADAGRRVLVLTGRIALAQEIAERLVENGFDAVALSSKTPKAARRAAVEGLRSGEVSVLVATTLADEGLDVPDLDCVILAIPSRSAAKTKQRAGRAVRPSGRPPLVFDLVDGDVFSNQWKARKAAYIREYGLRCLMLPDRLATIDEAREIASWTDLDLLYSDGLG
jgi:superfamily II DNA or RNA helicase